MTSGSLPTTPATPIGQVTCANSDWLQPRASSRCRKLAHLLLLPISPTKGRSPRSRWRCRQAATMSRSSACEKLMISTRDCASRSATAACTGAECSVCTQRANPAGKISSRLSIQRTRTGSGVSACTMARPTWPPPNSATGRRLASSAASSRLRSAAASAGSASSKSRYTTPPQHWPSEGPSAKRRCTSIAAPASAPRA